MINMSCENCEIMQEGGQVKNGQVVRFKGRAYYRWKNANVEIRGCDLHLLEIFEALNNAQRNGQKL